MQGPCKFPEQMIHGALLGSFFGTAAAGIEYALLYAHNSYVGNLAKAYWEILLPYTSAGLAAGICIAVLVRLLLGPPRSLSQHFARVGSALIALIVLSHLLVWATYRFLLPLWKPSNILAYLASLAVSVMLGVILYRIVKLLLEQLEGRTTTNRLRIGASVFLVVGMVVLFYGLPRITGRSGLVYGKATRIPFEGLSAKRPNIIFILVDTLRADHLPMYGYSRQTAPNLTALSTTGVTAVRMYAPAAATRPSVASIFSSLYPAVHKTNHERDFLPDSVVTLAESLRDAGYQTFGVSANANVSSVFGFAQGFDAYYLSRPESAFRLTRMGSVLEDVLSKETMAFLTREETEIKAEAGAITDFTLRWVGSNFSGPSFLYVHFLDPHWPYNPPPPFDKSFDHRRDPPLRARRVEPLQLIATDQNRAEIGHTIDRYDGEILYNDQEIGRLLAGLKQLGILDNALVIVTSDHGEEFWEHNQGGHDKTLYEEVVHVPFIMSWPGQIAPGSAYLEMVNLVDVMPTVLDFLGIKPSAGIQGFSFAKQITRDAPPNPQRKFFAQQINSQRSIEMVRHQRNKFIRHLHGPRAGQEEFYDLQRDPLERTNLIGIAGSQATAWRKELEAFNKLVRQPDLWFEKQQIKELDEEMIRALRALGYLQ
jgi:arylsulfatase A-like enzyme